jgi:hypothetical protein
MFEDKYNKYKRKYLDLKNQINNLNQQQGGRRVKGGENIKPVVILITRQLNESIIKKLKGLISVDINTYIMCDDEPIISDESIAKYILHNTDEKMESLRWTNHMSRSIHKITAWDKATYHAYTLNVPNVWIVEDDVYWNDDEQFKKLIEIDNNADLIGYPLYNKYSDDPKWIHWNKLNTFEITNNKELWSASYNQICRLSNRLLKKINELCKKRKRLYFHEIMFATLCKINNYKISYIPELKSDMFINIRWDRPFLRIQIKQLIKEHKYILLHPVKDNISDIN